MAKIAVLTLPLHTNYGGNLQAYALQHTLLQQGHEVCVLNFQALRRLNVKKILSKVKRALFFREILNLDIVHQAFIRKNLNITEALYTAEDLKNYVQKHQIDIIVVGSDQVWRKEYVLSHTDDMLIYFLNFVANLPVEKVSYAASFGIDHWQFDDVMTQQIKSLLNGFNRISVREDSARILCQQHLQLAVEHVLDPTMLTDMESYEKLIREVETKESIAQCRGKIFSYVLDVDTEKDNIQQHVARVLDKPITHNRVLNFFQLRKNMVDRVDARIENWLLAFKHADYVVTDSFHGTVFSILFKKPFIVVINKQRGATRFMSLLKDLNLENRILVDVNQVNNNYLYDIDYEDVYNRLHILKLKSLRFLKTI